MSDELNANENLDGQDDDIIIEDEDTGVVEKVDTDEVPKDETPKDETPKDDNDVEKPGTDDTSKEGTEKVDPVQKRINKVIYEKKAAEEALQAEKQAREELQKKYEEATKEVLAAVPDLPNVMDPEFEEKMAARDIIIRKHGEASAAQQAFVAAENQRAYNEQLAEEKKLTEMCKAFDDKTEELKLDKQSLLEASNTVGKFMGPNKTELAKYLLSSDQGPLNVLYLSQNAIELEKISNMSQTDAAVYIATEITPKAQELKPKTTNAPEPTYQPSGKGKIEDEDPNLEGCKFE